LSAAWWRNARRGVGGAMKNTSISKNMNTMSRSARCCGPTRNIGEPCSSRSKLPELWKGGRQRTREMWNLLFAVTAFSCCFVNASVDASEMHQQ
jgi:hypothetical protein